MFLDSDADEDASVVQLQILEPHECRDQPDDPLPASIVARSHSVTPTTSRLVPKGKSLKKNSTPTAIGTRECESLINSMNTLVQGLQPPPTTENKRRKIAEGFAQYQIPLLEDVHEMLWFDYVNEANKLLQRYVHHSNLLRNPPSAPIPQATAPPVIPQVNLQPQTSQVTSQSEVSQPQYYDQPATSYQTLATMSPPNQYLRTLMNYDNYSNTRQVQPIQGNITSAIMAQAISQSIGCHASPSRPPQG